MVFDLQSRCQAIRFQCHPFTVPFGNLNASDCSGEYDPKIEDYGHCRRRKQVPNVKPLEMGSFDPLLPGQVGLVHVMGPNRTRSCYLLKLVSFVPRSEKYGFP
ncbi:hypothetical protein TNCV_750381 [Trichonephila clavipes]|nr:hypothetical protein TNCV_750381 [Trichonephila clavipes]